MFSMFNITLFYLFFINKLQLSLFVDHSSMKMDSDLEGSGLPYMPDDIATLKNCFSDSDTNYSLHPG